MREILFSARSAIFKSASAIECREHAVVSFMTGVLVHCFARSLHRNLSGPAFRKRLGIVDRELVQERFGIGTREAFDEMHVFAGPSESHFAAEIGGVDDERISFPMSTRVTH